MDYTPRQKEWMRRNQRPPAHNNLYISETGSILQANYEPDGGIRMENLYTRQSTYCSDYWINFMSRPVTLVEFTEKEIFTMMLTGRVREFPELSVKKILVDK